MTQPEQTTSNFIRNIIDEDLQEGARRIGELASDWRDAFIYFKHEAEGRGPVLAAKLRTLLEQPDTPAATRIPA